jgi:hypothetical protein
MDALPRSGADAPRIRGRSRRADPWDPALSGTSRPAPMRKHVVVFVDVERHQPTDGRDAIERVEEEPLMFQRTPPRLDHRVRELQFREGQQTAQDSRVDQGVQPGRSRSPRPRLLTRRAHEPSQDASREVVDHGVHIGACPVQQADDRGVDVPHLVRCRRAQPHLRLGRMHPEPRASPAVVRFRRVS